MYLLEADLEEIIFNTDAKELAKKGLKINGKLIRQLRIGNYGIADLVSIYRVNYPFFSLEKKITSNIPTLCIDVIELKKDEVGVSAFLQAIGYVKGIQEYFNIRKFDHPIEIKIILIGKEVDLNSTFCYLPELLPNANSFEKSFLDVYTYDYDIDGVKFEFKNYELFDENEKGF